MDTKSLKVAIVGGGLVGALESCMLAKRGFDVTLFEARHDGRNEPSYYGRSINLAISHRGICALERLKLDDVVKRHAIPMGARMIHDTAGRTTAIPYDPMGRCINSIERAALNNYLLNKAQAEFNVQIRFNHKLVDMNAESGELWFRQRDDDDDDDQVHKYKFDLILGCDGARSIVRSLLARQSQMDVHQSFIEHGYMELRIAPLSTAAAASEPANGRYKMAPNYLHIWPRGKYMMIALPNTDCSFTCTLFAPWQIFDKLKSDNQEAMRFFKANFPDALELIGTDSVRETLAQVRASALISIKCKPYTYKHRVALLGDAAHAMVPFYGQGMNCGFEDCLVLDEMFDAHFEAAAGGVGGSLERVLAAYDERRCPNGHAMCDLAMYNYVEMRDLVNTFAFRMRKHMDNLLYRKLGAIWTPLYTMVTFTRLPIHECVRKRAQQDKLLARAGWLSLTCASAAALAGCAAVLVFRRARP